MFLKFLKKKEIFQYIYFDETSCCTVELSNFFSSKFDPERLGFKRTYDILNCDVFITCGFISEEYKKHMTKLFNKNNLNPKILAIGGCAISGGPLNSACINADIYLPGCPPRPESIVDCLLKLKKVK